MAWLIFHLEVCSASSALLVRTASASALTFVAGVKRAIEDHCPEILHIRQVKGNATASAQQSFVSPFAEAPNAWRFALDLAAIPEGGVAHAIVHGEALFFSRSLHLVSCFRDSCAHLGLPISDGMVEKGRITCPHHGFQYDLMTGECLTAPEVQLRPVPVRLVENRVEVRLEA